MQWMNLKNWGIRMKVLLYGYGLMGKKVAHQLREKDEFDLIGVVSYEFDEKAPEAMYSNLTEVQDRADVIIPAAEIYLFIANIVKPEYIYVPIIGLSDGIIDNLLLEEKQEEN